MIRLIHTILEPLSGIEINSKLNLLATIKENETERSLDLLLKEGYKQLSVTPLTQFDLS